MPNLSWSLLSSDITRKRPGQMEKETCLDLEIKILRLALVASYISNFTTFCAGIWSEASLIPEGAEIDDESQPFHFCCFYRRGMAAGLCTYQMERLGPGNTVFLTENVALLLKGEGPNTLGGSWG